MDFQGSIVKTSYRVGRRGVRKLGDGSSNCQGRNKKGLQRNFSLFNLLMHISATSCTNRDNAMSDQAVYQEFHD